jgi:hypothetical protein
MATRAIATTTMTTAPTIMGIDSASDFRGTIPANPEPQTPSNGLTPGSPLGLRSGTPLKSDRAAR